MHVVLASSRRVCKSGGGVAFERAMDAASLMRTVRDLGIV